MGDRGNIVVLQTQWSDKDKPSTIGQVWFYTHWRGSDIPEIVQTALVRNERWDDDSYLARIIFCELIKGREAEATSFGISTQLADNEYPITVVDIPNQRVFTIQEKQLVDGRVPDGWEPKEAWSFADYATKKLEPA